MNPESAMYFEIIEKKQTEYLIKHPAHKAATVKAMAARFTKTSTMFVKSEKLLTVKYNGRDTVRSERLS